MRVTIELSELELRDVLGTATESCAYWAQTEESLTQALVEPVAVTSADDGEPLGMLTRHCLTRVTFDPLDGGGSEWLLKCVAKYGPNLDNPAADAFVQLALFGKVLFG